MKYRISWFPKEEVPRIHNFINPLGFTGWCSNRMNTCLIKCQLMDVFPGFVFLLEVEMIECEIMTHCDAPEDMITVPGGDPSNPTWEKYVNGFIEEFRPHIKAIKKALIEKGWSVLRRVIPVITHGLNFLMVKALHLLGGDGVT